MLDTRLTVVYKRRMAHAHVLSAAQFQELLEHVARVSEVPLRDYAALLLSYKGGLRAQEIVGLRWRDVTDNRGRMGDTFTIPKAATKMRYSRTVPMHPVLKATLEHLYAASAPHNTAYHPIIRAVAAYTRPRDAAVSGEDRRHLSSAALRDYLKRLYVGAGFSGCSSHSGRRTFTTTALQRAGQYGCTLYDVQRVVGHRQAETTAAYVESSPAFAQLVRGL